MITVCSADNSTFTELLTCAAKGIVTNIAYIMMVTGIMVLLCAACVAAEMTCDWWRARKRKRANR